MGECIGFDFGTTYSMIARLNNENKIETVNFGSGPNPVDAIRTIVVKGKRGVRIGNSAINSIGKEGTRVFTGFKMLLNSSKELQQQRGYTQEDTPRKVTGDFLCELFSQYKDKTETEKIERVVVGVPHVWTNNVNIQSKSVVKEEIEKAAGPGTKVEFQSEPILAATYLTHTLSTKKKAPYQGYLFVVDYGGGTLDITLCRAVARGEASEIEVVESWGSGENTDENGRIGSAGLSYMEKVADLLLSSKPVTVYSKDEAEYKCFVKDIESLIIEQYQDIEEITKQHVAYSLDFVNETIAAKPVIYKGDSYKITFGILSEAYEQTIRPVLADTLNQAKAFMDANGIPYSDDQKESFKIATIGGFCTFPYTYNQVCEETSWLRQTTRKDTRYSDVSTHRDVKARERAVAYGAVLYANDIIKIKRQFPYSLSFFGSVKVKKDGVERIEPRLDMKYPVFVRNKEYSLDHPVFMEDSFVDSGKEKRRKVAILSNNIPFVEIAYSNPTRPIPPYEEIRLPRDTVVYIAVSMVDNEEMKLYVYNANVYNALSKEEKDNPNNKALISGYPKDLGTIYQLLGNMLPTDLQEQA